MLLQTVARAIDDKQQISRAMINEAMQAAFGATNASGAWSQRDSFEMLEHATVLALVTEQAINDDCSLAGFTSLSERLPTQTVRSEAQIAFQQFSTPLDIAWLVGQASRLCPSDIVLEPSVDTGLLVISAPRVHANFILNELDPMCHQLLKRSLASATLLSCDCVLIDAHNRHRIVTKTAVFRMLFLNSDQRKGA